MEPPAEMLMSLLPFQKEFLAWAVSQERSESRGGILADEMGMGKTIQVLSCGHLLYHHSSQIVLITGMSLQCPPAVPISC